MITIAHYIYIKRNGLGEKGICIIVLQTLLKKQN